MKKELAHITDLINLHFEYIEKMLDYYYRVKNDDIELWQYTSEKMIKETTTLLNNHINTFINSMADKYIGRVRDGEIDEEY